MARTTKSILKSILRHRPTTTKDFRKLGIALRFIGEGVYRRTYRIVASDLVVKIPIQDAGGIQHSKDEIVRLRKLKRYRVMRAYLPVIQWWDKKSGVVVMTYYPKFHDHEEQVDSMGKMVSRLIRAATGIYAGDIHSENVHKRDKTSVIIDLGF